MGSTDAAAKRLSRLLPVMVVAGVSCDDAIRSGTLIDAYRVATCVSPIYLKDVGPPTRGWEASVPVGGSSTAVVRGADMVGGGITVRFESDGNEVRAIQPGDYIYPKDVRITEHGRLLVKASGPAGGIRNETWLYEYDLPRRTLVRRNKVDPEVLPTECPMPGQ